MRVAPLSVAAHSAPSGAAARATTEVLISLRFCHAFSSRSVHNPPPVSAIHSPPSRATAKAMTASCVGMRRQEPSS